MDRREKSVVAVIDTNAALETGQGEDLRARPRLVR
jgi:hypothetical protein